MPPGTLGKCFLASSLKKEEGFAWPPRLWLLQELLSACLTARAPWVSKAVDYASRVDALLPFPAELLLPLQVAEVQFALGSSVHHRPASWVPIVPPIVRSAPQNFLPFHYFRLLYFEHFLKSARSLCSKHFLDWILQCWTRWAKRAVALRTEWKFRVAALC